MQLEKEKTVGDIGYVNKNCWLAKNMNVPPSERCRYCELRLNGCLFTKYLIISLFLVGVLLAISYFFEGSISKVLIISIFLLVIVYGYFFNRSTESIIKANFATKKSNDALEELTKTLQQKVEEQTKSIKISYEAEKTAKEKIDAIRVEDEAILSSIGDGVVAMSKAGKIMFINKAAEHMLGFSSKESVGASFEEILFMLDEKEEVIKKGESSICRVLRCEGDLSSTDSNYKEAHYYLRKDKIKFPVAVTVAPILLNKNVIGAVDVFRDITIEKQIDKSKTEFVSLASHQLRTPLSAIKWYAEILFKKKSGKLSKKQKKYLDEIYRGNERMIGLVDMMLNVSRLDAGKIKNEPKDFNVKNFIDEIIVEQKFEIKKKKQKVSFECEDKKLNMFADHDLIRMILQNLISNAIKYTPEKGEIFCRVSENGEGILFEVADTGIGIPENQQDRIFKKLFRASNAFPHDPDGNGLGLYMVKSVVESLNGRIWFESEEGKGTRFFVILPKN